MALKFMLTSSIFFVLFIGVIKFHEGDRPADWIVKVEVFGVLISAASFVVSILFLIWQA